MAWTKSTTTRHTCNGGEGPYFGRKTVGCPRCDELLSGAEPVKGWNYHRDRWEAQHLEAIRNHDCKKSNCSVVCTFGDW